MRSKTVFALSMAALWCIVFGSAMHNRTLGVCMGLCMGAAFGLFSPSDDGEKRNKEETEGENEHAGH